MKDRNGISLQDARARWVLVHRLQHSIVDVSWRHASKMGAVHRILIPCFDLDMEATQMRFGRGVINDSKFNPTNEVVMDHMDQVTW